MTIDELRSHVKYPIITDRELIKNAVCLLYRLPLSKLYCDGVNMKNMPLRDAMLGRIFNNLYMEECDADVNNLYELLNLVYSESNNVEYTDNIGDLAMLCQGFSMDSREGGDNYNEN